MGNVLSREDTATGARVEYTWEPGTSRLKKVFDAECVHPPHCGVPVVELTYDPEGRGNLVRVAERPGTADEAITTVDYDEKGRVVRVVDAEDQVEQDNATHFEYSDGFEEGNLTAIRQDVPGASPLITEFAYDAAGNLTEVKDAEGRASRYEYDLTGRLIRLIDALGNATELSYDANGNLASVTDARPSTPPQTTLFDYDVRDRLSKRTVPEPGTTPVEEHYTYTASDLLKQFTDRMGRVTTYRYDSIGRLRKRVVDGPELSDEAAYEYAYDTRSRLTEAFGPGLANELKYSYAYDPPAVPDIRHSEVTVTGWRLGSGTSEVKLLSVANRNGFRTGLEVRRDGSLVLQTDYVPDDLGRLRKLRRAYDGAPVEDFAELTYDKLGRTIRLDYLQGVTLLGTTGYAYDDLGRLIELANTWGTTPVSKFQYTNYDGAGNYRTRVDTRDGGPSVTHDFRFDELDRLVAVTSGPTPVETFCWDEVGNRVGYGTGTASCGPTWSYAVPNRIVSDATWTYAHDLNGNLTTKTGPGGTYTFRWDGEDRLIGIEDGLGTEVGSARYDAFGRRVEKTWFDGGEQVTRRYVYDGFNIAVELDGTGELLAAYVHGDDIDEPLGMRRNLVEYQYFGDLLGSVVELIDRSAFEPLIRNRYTYTAFGRTTLTSPAEGPIESPFAYTGREWEPSWSSQSDEREAFYFYRARYYSPALGRFLTEDPLGVVSGDLNLYRYVANLPLQYRDPYGRLKESPGLYFRLVPTGGTGLATAVGSASAGAIAGVVVAGLAGGYGLGRGLGHVPIPNGCGRTVDDVTSDFFFDLLYTEPTPTLRPRPTKSKCLDAAAAGGRAWIDFCNSLPERDRAQCFAKSYESETYRRNFCHYLYST